MRRTVSRRYTGLETGPADRRAGFSMAEVLTSLVLLTTILMAFLSAANLEIRFLRHQNLASQAIVLLDSVTEELLLLSTDDDELEAGDHTRQFDRQGFPATGESVFFTVRWRVSSVEDVANIRRLELSASWDESGSHQSLGWTTYRN